MNITLRQLTYFKALAEQKHFGRAADIVNVSQPALSVQIRQLEADLGRKLVERGAREVSLTPFGRRILTHAKRVLSEMEALENSARWRGGLAGRLNLGMIPTIAPYLLTGALEALRTRDISLDVHVQEGMTDRLIGQLQDGHLDAAVMALPVMETGLIAEALFEDRFLLAGTASRLAELGGAPDRLRPTTLGTAPLLLLDDGHCLTDQALEICGRARGHAQLDTGASSLPTLSRLVAAGFGLTFMPELAAPTELRAAPDMRVLRFAPPEPARQIGLVRRASSTSERWFDELAEVLRRVGLEALDVARTSLAQKADPHPGGYGPVHTRLP